MKKNVLKWKKGNYFKEAKIDDKSENRNKPTISKRRGHVKHGCMFRTDGGGWKKRYGKMRNGLRANKKILARKRPENEDEIKCR